MTHPNNTTPAFDNGLTSAQDQKISFILTTLAAIRSELIALPRHRCYSLATTKIEEAEHWLAARRLELE